MNQKINVSWIKKKESLCKYFYNRIHERVLTLRILDKVGQAIYFVLVFFIIYISCCPLNFHLILNRIFRGLIHSLCYIHPVINFNMIDNYDKFIYCTDVNFWYFYKYMCFILYILTLYLFCKTPGLLFNYNIIPVVSNEYENVVKDNNIIRDNSNNWAGGVRQILPHYHSFYHILGGQILYKNIS